MTAVLPGKAVTETALPPAVSWWRRVGKHPRFMHYNRLIALVLAGLWWTFRRYGRR